MNFASVFDASAGKQVVSLFKQVAHKLTSQAAGCFARLRKKKESGV